MKHIITWGIVLLMLCSSAKAQTITTLQYWYDGNMATATTQSTTNATTINFINGLSAASLSLGYHKITMRFKDNNGAYSVPVTYTFVVTGTNITAYDYWWDGNYASHKLVILTAAQSVNVQAITPYGINPGTHLLGIRFKDAQGNWSIPVQDAVLTTVFIAPSGIQTISAIQNLILYPNPTAQNATLEFKGFSNEVLNMDLVDGLGHTLQHQQWQNNIGTNKHEIQTSMLASGVYFVNISSAKGAITKRLVVE
ncbi:MAG: T9SS type A sorting domain-containing protein [Chitinophagaceae bacterium]